MNTRQIHCYFTIAIVFILTTFHYAHAQKSNAVHTYTKDVEAQGVKSVNIQLNQAAGTFTLSGGASKLMEAQFSYSKEEWKPEITYTKENEKGVLIVKQQKRGDNINMEDKDRNDWKIKLTNAIPLDMKLTIGAGQSNIDLHSMKLSNLLMEAGAGDFTVNLANTSVPTVKINAGVGEMKLDLTGNWSNNLAAQINGGIGEITLKLPRKTGVRVKVNGLGNLEADGFKKEGGYYVNDAYKSGKVHLTIEINGGLGSVNLELEK